MSLLLDALKKAALDKQHREQQIFSGETNIGDDENIRESEDEEQLLAQESHQDEQDLELEFDASEFEEYLSEPRRPQHEVDIEQPEPQVEQPRFELKLQDEEMSQDLLTEESVLDEAVLDNASPSTQKAEPLSLTENLHQEQLERKQAMGKLIARNEAALKQKKRQRVTLLLLLAGISAIAIGLYYFYLKVSFDSQSVYASALQTPLAPVEQNTESTTEDTVVVEITSEETLVEEAVVAETPVAETPKPVVQAEHAPPNTPAVSAPVKSKTPMIKEKFAKQKTAQQGSVESLGVISKSEPVPSPLAVAIETGFQAWQRGDWTTAQQAYQRALALDPHHRDAVLGAAAVAAQLGNEREALRLYQQRLERAPRDEYALAGLLALGNLQSEDGAMESELNVMLRDFPQAAHLHYLKGLLHAQRGQWSAAQGYFFDAWKLDANRADYVFNLAVAMDHLGLSMEALQFYKQAQVLSQNFASNFSHQALEQRVAQLQAQTDNTNKSQK